MNWEELQLGEANFVASKGMAKLNVMFEPPFEIPGPALA